MGPPSLWTPLQLLVLAIALALGTRVYLFSRPCGEDDSIIPIPIPEFFAKSGRENFDLDPCRAFSGTYEEARSKFYSSAKTLQLEVQSLVVVAEKNYTIDILVVPGDLPGLTIHSSGVHGVEGYAGSAVQVAFLQWLAGNKPDHGEEWRPLSNMPTVILIHAVNPYGMAEYRRPNEQNVDLNRNSMPENELKSLVLFHENHEFYRKFDDFFNQRRKASSFDAYVRLWFEAVYMIIAQGQPALKAAMVGGQYYQDQGIFYGGDSVQTSSKLLEDWFKSYLASNHRLEPNHRSKGEKQVLNTEKPVVTWIDIHTGLGPSGVDTIIVNPFSALHPKRDQRKELEDWFPGAPSGLNGQENSDNDVTQGYQHSRGFLVDHFEKHIFDDVEYESLALCQEFGTVPNVLVGHALMIENAAFFSKDLTDEEKLQWAKSTTMRAFYPQSTHWRKSVLERGLSLLFQACERSATWRIWQEPL